MKKYSWLHFIGIKGVGMSALAIVAQGMGYKVTGADVTEEFITDSSLLDAGIRPRPGFSKKHIDPEMDLVVIGAAFGLDNPEVQEAHTLAIETCTYSQLQGFLTENKKTLAIAGTHGKTTTTSLVSYLLYKAGKEPSWIIGTGHVKGLPSHGHAGKGEYFVTEADDYKAAPNDPTPKFLDLNPWGAVITSIEHDHPDLYPTLEDCVTAFRRFIDRLNPDGFLVAHTDDKNIRQLLDEVETPRLLSYGFESTALYQIQETTSVNNTTHFTLKTTDRSYGPFHLPLPGKHNLLNATAAILVALEAGVSEEEIKTILPTFENVERRYHVLGERNGITVIDDYAHHPTAVTLTLEAAKKQFPEHTLWCVFQSHTYSRTKVLLHEFGAAFGAADKVVVTDIFASARETDVTVTSEELTQAIVHHHPHVTFVSKDELVSFLQQNVKAPAVVVTMGAGDIYKIGKAYLNS